MHTIYQESFGIIPLQYANHNWQVLIILHTQGNHWGFPKGNPSPGESAEESAKRELLEETGLVVEKLLQKEPITEQYTFFRKNERVCKKISYFPALVVGQIALQLEEVREAKWLSLKEAEQFLSFKEAKAICVQIEKRLNGCSPSSLNL